MTHPRCIGCDTEAPPLIPLAGNLDRPLYTCLACHEPHYVTDGPWPAPCTRCGDPIETGQTVLPDPGGWHHADHRSDLAAHGDIPLLNGRDEQ